MAYHNPNKHRTYKGQSHYGEYDEFMRFKAQVDEEQNRERMERQRRKAELKSDIHSYRSRFVASLGQFRTYRGSPVDLVIVECFQELNESCDAVWAYDSSEYLRQEVDQLISKIENAYNEFQAARKEKARIEKQVRADQNAADAYINAELNKYFKSPQYRTPRGSSVDRVIDTQRARYSAERKLAWDNQDASFLMNIARDCVDVVAQEFREFRAYEQYLRELNAPHQFDLSKRVDSDKNPILSPGKDGKFHETFTTEDNEIRYSIDFDSEGNPIKNSAHIRLNKGSSSGNKRTLWRDPDTGDGKD